MAAPMRRLQKYLVSTLENTSYIRHDGHVQRIVRLQSSAASVSKRWQLHSAVCLQRYPVLTQPLTPFEKQYQDYLNTVEKNKSLLSDHELLDRADKARKQAESKEGKKKEKAQSNILTAEEMEDEWQKEIDSFITAEQVTAEDKAQDLSSVNQQLDKKLVLIVKQQLGQSSTWILPQISHQESESMRQTAERALQHCCGDKLNSTFMGNAPSGYLSYKLPPGSEEDYGVKLFFFKAEYKSGSVMKTEGVEEHRWVSIDDLPKYLHPRYMAEIQNFLINL